MTSPSVPQRVLPRSIAGPRLISQIPVSKFGDHLPLYRQEDIFTRHGLSLSRSTLCDWVKSAAELLRSLYELLKEHVLASGGEIVRIACGAHLRRKLVEARSSASRPWGLRGDVLLHLARQDGRS